jgi:hypothetical protein
VSKLTSGLSPIAGEPRNARIAHRADSRGVAVDVVALYGLCAYGSRENVEAAY